jgi:hypothetical protein
MDTWAACDEYTGESLLPGDKCAGESRLPGLFCTTQNCFTKQIPGPYIARSLDSTIYSLQLSLHSREYLALAGIFAHQSLVDHRFISPGSGESRLHGGEYTRESVKNTNNSRTIGQNSKSFLGMFNGIRRNCLMKKRRLKSPDSAPVMNAMNFSD